eukprot:TRINITY_DN9215_c0_g1_i1.p1 TRINITY_DN9215_c0_g1~~TRINITY_DN9215_c0_g1_i1.p1  ORF type:complete len:826 (-),score=162.22 TRINITY_DN9215_c0_g1_i1:23-2263(-)
MNYVDLNDKPTPVESAPQVLFSGSWKVAFSAQADVHLSIEEKLLRERMRLSEVGVTSYILHHETNQFLLPIGGSLYTANSHSEDLEIRNIPHSNNCLDPKWSPDANIISYIKNNDIWILEASTGKSKRITHSALKGEHISSGVSTFVIQEEFDRFTGYWWSPKVIKNGNEKVYYIVFFEEDESLVEPYSIPQPSYEGKTEDSRYPMPGKKNPTSNLYLAEIKITEGGIEDAHVNIYGLTTEIGTLFPWCEYVVRCGWFNDGTRVWCQLLDRKQQHIALVSFHLNSFFPFSSPGPHFPIQVLLDEFSEVWINVTDMLHFFEDGSERFLWVSEISGFMQLYLLTPNGKFTPSAHYVEVHHNSQALTTVGTTVTPHGSTIAKEWVIDRDSELNVDHKNEVVYFSGTYDTPLELHVYVASFKEGSDPNNIQRLTSPSLSHSQIHMKSDKSIFATQCSSISTPVSIHVYRIHHKDNALPSSQHIYTLPVSYPTLSQPMPLNPPKIFTFRNKAGIQIFGAYFLPTSYHPGSSESYPTIIKVYGGPNIQTVQNYYQLTCNLEMQMYSQLGFVCVMIDNVGSLRRGLKFEGKIREKMGTVELHDQVEGIEFLVKEGVPINKQRIGITGWSYGAYLSLMAIGQHGHVFKVGIPKCPVSLWEAYDTAYTERYMDTPQNNPKGYHEGSVLTYVPNFPNTDGRLLLVHGVIDENVHFAHTTVLIDELIKQHKPYDLLILPKERHGCSNTNTRHYLKTR